MLLRSRRYYNQKQLFKLYKSHILSFLKSSTPGVFHAARSHLELVDHLQDVFLREVGISSCDALRYHNLAPLRTRRDIAMLGMIHRAALQLGPAQFWHWLRLAPNRERRTTRLAARRHNKQLVDMCDGSQSALLARSAFGLVKVYNLLPQDVIDRRSVKLFQKALQTLVKDEMECGRPNWDTCLSTVYGGAFLSRRQG